MDEKNNSVEGTRTAWHPMLVFVLEHFAPAHRKLAAEHNLNRLPQRVDIVILELLDVPAEPVLKFHSIFDYAKKHTLIEYKGVTDDLEPADVFVLLGYACQYVVLNNITRLEVGLMFIAERIPSSVVEQIEDLGGTFEDVGNGLWRGTLAGFSLHGVALREAHQAASSERLLYLFTRAFLRDPGASRFTEGLDEKELDMYDRLCQHIHQLRRDPETMHMKDLDTAEQSLAAARRRLIANAPIEERLAGLTPEERVAGLKPEERVAGLSPEILEFLAQKAKRR